MSEAPVLEVRGVSKAFGGLKAVQEFNLTLRPRHLCGLIGPNGAGKTTAFNLLTGVYQPDCGTVRLCGRDVVGLKPHKIAAAGMARTFQNIRLFNDLSVLDNVRLACHLRVSGTTLGAVARTVHHRREEAAITARAMELLRLFDLEERALEEAKGLAYGDRRRLEIARALATEPVVLLLDEPAAGMNPQEKKSLRELIFRLREEFQVAILLIEHDMGVVMGICEEITVLDHGVTISHGTPEKVQKDPKVIEAYLGSVDAENGHA